MLLSTTTLYWTLLATGRSNENLISDQIDLLALAVCKVVEVSALKTRGNQPNERRRSVLLHVDLIRQVKEQFTNARAQYPLGSFLNQILRFSAQSEEGRAQNLEQKSRGTLSWQGFRTVLELWPGGEGFGEPW